MHTGGVSATRGSPEDREGSRKKAADKRPADSVHCKCGVLILSELNRVFLCFLRNVQEKWRRSKGDGGLMEAWGRAWPASKLCLFVIKRSTGETLCPLSSASFSPLGVPGAWGCASCLFQLCFATRLPTEAGRRGNNGHIPLELRLLEPG